MDQSPSQAKSVRRERRAPWYRYSRFWFSLAISCVVISTLLMLFQSPRDPYDTQTGVDAWLRPAEPGRAREMNTLRADLNSVAISTDGIAVWVAGNAGLIATTTDGGKSWQKEKITGNPSTITTQGNATTDTTAIASKPSVSSQKKH
jgi:hypothetical protein